MTKLLFVPAIATLVSAADASPSVTGNVISWPNDGWYQVQLASTYQTVCEGGSSCEVSPGVYNAINHTTGERFENIEVRGASDARDGDNVGTERPGVVDTRTDSWSLENDTITFQAEGWYQVQDQGFGADFETVCEGSSPCSVVDGMYQVINHTTGEIWQQVRVGLDSVFWQQTGLFESVVEWIPVSYNHEASNRFRIYLNGELVADTSATRVVLSELERGTRYRLEVYSVRADGAEELVGVRDVLTDGPEMSVVTYGKPDEQRDTFGFEYWDSKTAEVQSLLPSDCLFSHPYGEHCFSPSTRFLIGGAAAWEFALPGDDSTNHIEGLAHFFGRSTRNSSLKEFALVTDVTTEFARSKYEISVFRHYGTFLGTYPILEGIRDSAGSGIRREINLDGADIQVDLGPVRPYESFSWNDTQPRRLHIRAEYYEPNGSGSVTGPGGWDRKGAVLAVVDAQSGETLSQTFYPGFTMDEVADP